MYSLSDWQAVADLHMFRRLELYTKDELPHELSGASNIMASSSQMTATPKNSEFRRQYKRTESEILRVYSLAVWAVLNDDILPEVLAA